MEHQQWKLQVALEIRKRYGRIDGPGGAYDYRYNFNLIKVIKQCLVYPIYLLILIHSHSFFFSVSAIDLFLYMFSAFIKKILYKFALENLSTHSN